MALIIAVSILVSGMCFLPFFFKRPKHYDPLTMNAEKKFWYIFASGSKKEKL
jgi:hypothetical protein